MRLRPRHPLTRLVSAGLVTGVVALVVALAGCSATATSRRVPTAAASATARPIASAAVPGAVPTPAGSVPPRSVPHGSAQANLAAFTAVVRAVWAGPDRVPGRAYIDALVAAGFDKKSMQVTDDETTIGRAAESIQFSVHWDDGKCLVGQVGPDTGAPVTAVMPSLGGGVCLLGATRDIDW